MKNVYKLEKISTLMKLLIIMALLFAIYGANNSSTHILIEVIAVLILIITGLMFFYIIPKILSGKFSSEYERIIVLSYAKKNFLLSKAYKNDIVCSYYYEIIIKYLMKEKVYKELKKDTIYCNMSKVEKYKTLNKIFFNNRFLYEITSSNSLEDEFLKKVIDITEPFQKDLYSVENLRYLKLGKYYDKFQDVWEH